MHFVVTEELVRRKSEHNELLISTLEELTLHQEDIEKIEHLQNWCRDLKILLLQSNLISKIENLHKLKRLEYLNLAINNIERVENLEKLESLNKLDLTLNFIGELTSIESLCENYNLRILILTGNPCCEYPGYREYVIATLPQLESLDGEEATRTQKLRAKPKLKNLREIIVQRQAEYAIQRDEQKIRFLLQKEELEAKMASIENEEERTKLFWQSSSEHCPEIRYEMSKYHRASQDAKKSNQNAPAPQKEPLLFAPCGRPYNLNKPKLNFRLKDELDCYILELDVYRYSEIFNLVYFLKSQHLHFLSLPFLLIYRYLDTSYLDVNVEVNYIRVNVKKKIFQISLNEEVTPSTATVQRSQITGQLVVKAPKLKWQDTSAVLTIPSKFCDS